MVYDNQAYISDDPLEKGEKPGFNLGEMENGRVPEVSVLLCDFFYLIYMYVMTVFILIDAHAERYGRYGCKSVGDDRC